jgi:hypothetical protein
MKETRQSGELDVMGRSVCKGRPAMNDLYLLVTTRLVIERP